MPLPSELLAKKECWTKKAEARDKDGLATHCKQTDATCWCVIGAAFACFKYEKATRFLSIVRRIVGQDVDDWNDSEDTDHDEMLVVVKDAEAMLKREEKRQ